MNHAPSCCAPEPRLPVIQMRRGDTLYFLDQLFQNPVTGQYETARPGTPPPEGCVPVNIAGCTIWFTAKDDSAIPDIQAPFQLDNAALGGVAIVTAASGIFSVTGSALITQGFADGDTVLRYDVQFQLTNGNIVTPEYGKLEVFADITRALAPWQPGKGPGPAFGPMPGGVAFFQGAGSPNGVVVASPGALYSNTLGGAGATLWVKESGANTNTGWVSK